ncbi:MAG TPA: VWA domain-containing protein [Vicinamibacterales bacterium]
MTGFERRPAAAKPEAHAFALGALVIVVSSLVALGSQTPAPPQPEPQPPTFRTEANYVRVDVYPTHDGEPVLDLKQDDFEVIEGNAPQKVEQFEHVMIHAATPQDVRLEPNSVRESMAMVANSRARVFVIFLDIGHVEVDGSRRIRAPLVKALDSLIGPEDLVAVMTPEMSPSDITFARKTTTIEGFLARHWNWGERDQVSTVDAQEQLYKECYPGLSQPLQCPDGTTDDDRGVADEMIARRREKMTIDALSNLVTYLRGVREERKAVLAISDGWLLYKPNPGLARKLNCQVPGLPTGGFDPRTGRLSAGVDRDPISGVSLTSCDRDRMMLAALDDDQEFRTLLDQANRANTSFYPVDPRGLVVFDTSIAMPTTGAPPPGSTTITPPSVDQAMLTNRLYSLRTLAEATDGLAIVNSNDLDRGFRRVVSDLSSYYLLGYYSSGKLDGKFHSITVRVKRPGVRVRARRGYLAATIATAGTSTRGGGSGAAKSVETPEAAAAAAAGHAVEASIAPLSGYGRDVPLRLQMTAGWKPGDSSSASMWLVGELGGSAVVGVEWNEGFEVSATLAASSDASVATGRVTVGRNLRTFRLALTSTQPIVAGDYTLSVIARAASASIPARETMHVSIPAAPASVGALYLRRGISTGNKDTPTADLRFRRSEQIRVELPAISPDPVTARLLDRTGKPLAVPVAAATRDDTDGSRWWTAGLALAPLAPGDYVIELSSGSQRTLASFRIVP